MKTELTKPVIILSGPVGSGKTSVAKELIKNSVDPTVYIEGDKFWFFIAKGFENIGHVRNFKTVMASMTAAALPYALSGYDVILDFSIPPWFLPTAFKMTNRREVPLDYVVLMPGESECASRAAARTEGQITDYSRYHDLYLSFKEAGQYSIQNDSIGASDAANMIREDLKKGRFRILQ